MFMWTEVCLKMYCNPMHIYRVYVFPQYEEKHLEMYNGQEDEKLGQTTPIIATIGPKSKAIREMYFLFIYSKRINLQLLHTFVTNPSPTCVLRVRWLMSPSDHTESMFYRGFGGGLHALPVFSRIRNAFVAWTAGPNLDFWTGGVTVLFIYSHHQAVLSPAQHKNQSEL